MSDAPAPDQPGRTPAGDGAAPAPDEARAALTPEAIDAVLADFRAWLADASTGGFTAAPEGPATLDLATVVGHFTALRHEVNLLTKSARAAVEQNGEALRLLQAPAADPDAAVLPLVKVVIDIADSLATALRQVERGRAAMAELLETLAEEAEPPPRPGYLARLLGAQTQDRTGAVRATVERLRPLTAGLADGYAMSLRRVERVWPQFGVEAIDCLGLPFDPELMEAVEAVAGEPGGPGRGAVVEEVRRGYRRDGAVLRYALVKVVR